ncbi:MAG: hypothetical protein WCZ18_09040 [Ottowia sp.]|nr:hypothetical protein [Ottowia sp.]
MYFRSSSSRWGARLLTFAVWALVAGSAVFWALQRPPRMAAGSGVDDVVALAGSVDVQRVARALGAAGPQAPQATDTATAGQLRLLGVITQGAGGAVLVSVDDAPARPVRVGQAPAGLGGAWVLQAVAPHSAVFAAGDEQMELHMPSMEERSRAGDAVAPERGPAGRAGAGATPDDAARRASERRTRLLQRAARPDR